jgi:glycosyltransferase involved in cell wall biosynthesis
MVVPRISICIPTYNMAQFIGLSVQSVLNQTYCDFEIVICDNASTDNTSDILGRFQDLRIKFFRNSKNVGAISNFNLAIERASTEWIKFLEADDLLEPTCLEKCMAMVRRDSEVDVVSVGRTRIYADGTPFLREVHWKTEVVSGMTVRQRVHIRHNEFGTPTDVMLRKNLLDSVGGFDTDYGTYLNDWDLWLKCQEKARKVAFIAESLVLVRTHSGQIGAAGAKSNIDIDVLCEMLKKRWMSPWIFSSLWFQRTYLEFVLLAPYFYRGIKQFISGATPVGVRRWDAFSRLLKHLGGVRLLGIAIFTPFYLPLMNWGKRFEMKSDRISDTGGILPAPFHETCKWAIFVILVYILILFAMLWLIVKFVLNV